MARKKKHEEHVNHERWLVSYADFITLLFATFTALYALGNADIEKFKKMSMSMDRAFNGDRAIVPVINIDPTAQGSGDMVIQIVDAQQTRPSKGKEDGKKRGDGKSQESFNAVEMAMQRRQQDSAQVPPPNEDHPEVETDPTKPDPAHSPQMTTAQLLVPGATPEAASPEANQDEETQLGAAEGKANDALAQQIQQLMESSGVAGKVEVRKEVRGTVISLGEAAFFSPGGIDILPQSIHTLDRILNALRGKEFEVRIEGHTDNLPVGSGRRYNSNEELSSLRAARIMEFMMREYGFPGNKLSVAGFGAWRPLASNDTPEGRQKNRRVDIVILNQSEISKDPR